MQYRVLGTTLWTTVNINSNLTTYSLAGLQLSTSYEWKIATRCSTNVYAAYSAKASFTTAIARDNNERIHSPGNTLTVYPNPTHEILNISFTNEFDGNGRLEIFNSIGQVVYSKNIFISNGEYLDQINLKLFSLGLYLVRIEKGELVKMVKVLKE